MNLLQSVIFHSNKKESKLKETDFIWDLVEIVKGATGCTDDEAQKAAGKLYRKFREFSRYYREQRIKK